MADPIDLSADIQDAASGPKTANVDGLVVTSQDPEQVIAADRYLASKRAANRGAGIFGVIQFQRTTPRSDDSLTSET